MRNFLNNIKLPARLGATGRCFGQQEQIVFLVSLRRGRRSAIVLAASVRVFGKVVVVALAPRRVIERRIVSKDCRIQLVAGYLPSKFGLDLAATVARYKTLGRPLLDCLGRKPEEVSQCSLTTSSKANGF